MFSSCNYESSVSPFVSSMILGSIFSSIILARMRSNDTQIITKLYEIEKDMKNMKAELEKKK